MQSQHRVFVGLAALVVPLMVGAQAPRKLVEVDSLQGPEAVSYDAALDVYFVSNVNGSIGAKDGNGFITRIRGDGRVDSLHFIQGGRGGVTLNGPMGSRVQGDTLWVLDIDVLRGFNARTGAPVATIDLSPVHALLLNDLAIGPDGDFYITDTGVQVGADGKINHTGPDRIYHVARDRKVTIALESAALDSPDGIDWDPRHKELILAPIGGMAVQTWTPGAPAPVNATPGKGRYDGIEIEKDGTVYITSWADSTVSTFDGKTLTPVIHASAPPADISVDAKRHQGAIVCLVANRFELWTIPAK
jgi:sugar lactone lactonase YvrE